MRLRSAFSTFNKPFIWAYTSPRELGDSDLVGPGWGQKFCISNWPRGDAHVSLWTRPGTARPGQWFSNISPHQNHQGDLGNHRVLGPGISDSEVLGWGRRMCPSDQFPGDTCCWLQDHSENHWSRPQKSFDFFWRQISFLKKPTTFYTYHSVHSNTYLK